MRDRYKTKGQLINDLETCRKRLAELEGLEKELENEQRWPERALHETEKRYEALLETNLYGIQEIDIYGIITYMNSVLYKILGYKMGELKGRQIWDLLANDTDRDKLTDYLTRIAEGEYAPFPWVGEYIRKNGRAIRLQVDWNYRKDTQGRITGFISVISSVVEGGDRPAIPDGTDSDEAADEVLEEEMTEEAGVPAGAMLDGIDQRIAAMGDRLDALHQDFQRKLKLDAQKSATIDRLHQALLDEKRQRNPAEEREIAQEAQAPLMSEAVENGIDRIEKGVKALMESFEGKLKHDAHKNQIIDKLHEDLQEYKSDFLKKFVQSIIMDIIQVIDDLRKLARHYEEQGLGEADARKLLDILKGIPSELEDLFFRQGVMPFTCDGNAFDPSRQRVLKTLITTDRDKDKTIAESIRPGYEWDGTVIRPEIVAAYIHKEPE